MAVWVGLTRCCGSAGGFLFGFRGVRFRELLLEPLESCFTSWAWPTDRREPDAGVVASGLGDGTIRTFSGISRDLSDDSLLSGTDSPPDSSMFGRLMWEPTPGI